MVFTHNGHIVACPQAAKRKKGESSAAARRKGQEEERGDGSLFEVVKNGKASLQVSQGWAGGGRTVSAHCILTRGLGGGLALRCKFGC